MLNIKTFTVNPLQENCYVVSDETRQCVIIDCGAYSDEERSRVVNYIKEQQLTPKHHILTHAHIDHCMGADTLYAEFALPIDLHAYDVPMLSNAQFMAETFLKYTGEVDLPPVGRELHDKDTISFGSHHLSVIESPGHSRGGILLYSEDEKVLFTGDTLFCGSIGRTDLPGGSMFHIIQSLRMICQLPDDVTIYAGHGPSTTIGHECATNMFLDR